MNETIKSYFKTTFEKKKVITKSIILAIAFVLVLIPSLSFYLWLKDKTGVVGGTNKFWYIQVEWNPGVAFSGLSGKPGAIYAIQSVVFVVLLALFWFLVKDKISASFIALAIFGGLFNLIQRAAAPAEHAHMVLDYFKFGFWENFAVFNWPDMFVVCGIIGFIISFITHLIIDSVRDSKANKKALQDKANDEKPVEQK